MLIESTLDGALLLASHGLHVVRLHYPIFREDRIACSCGNPKCTAQGKHPVGMQWGKTATTDADTIRDLWRESDWNVGVLMGTGHGIPEDQAVIDIEDDTLEGRNLADALLRDYPTVSWSSGKSIHRLYRWDPRLPSVANMTVQGLEFRFGGAGKETQSVAPPSVHRSRRKYQWVEDRSPDKIGIGTIPQHVLDWILEQFAMQSEGKVGGAPSNNSHKSFRIPGQKVHEPGRNNAMVRHANSCWRQACQLFGYNRLDDTEVRDQVWLWVWGANLATCEPPLDQDEVFSLFLSAERFMRGELAREMQEKLALTQTVPAEHVDNLPEDLSTPTNSDGEEVPAEESQKDLDAKSRVFSDYLAKYGIRLSLDPMGNPLEKSVDRIDEWQAPAWKLTYVTKGDQDYMKVTVCGVTATLKPPEFERHRDVARKIAQESLGKVLLDRTFAHWSWKKLWEGSRNGEDNGITRGLREYLVNHARVEEVQHMTLVDQIAGLVESLIGGKSQIMAAYQQYCSSPAMSGRKASVPNGRLKLSPNGDLVALRAPEDPASGVYSEASSGKLVIAVKFEEIAKRYKSAYTGSVSTEQIGESLEKLGFRKERIRSGVLEGRWFLKNLGKTSEKDLDTES